MSGALHEYSVHDSLKSSLAFRKLATTAVSEPPQAGCDEGSGCDEKGPLRFGGLSIVFLWQRCHSRHGQLRDRWPNCAAFRGVRAFHLPRLPCWACLHPNRGPCHHCCQYPCRTRSRSHQRLQQPVFASLHTHAPFLADLCVRVFHLVGAHVLLWSCFRAQRVWHRNIFRAALSILSGYVSLHGLRRRWGAVTAKSLPWRQASLQRRTTPSVNQMCSGKIRILCSRGSQPDRTILHCLLRSTWTPADELSVMSLWHTSCQCDSATSVWLRCGRSSNMVARAA